MRRIEQAAPKRQIVQHDNPVDGPAHAPRAGWAEAAARFGPSPLLDPPARTAFDAHVWSWKADD
jgi:hypothetical protein